MRHKGDQVVLALGPLQVLASIDDGSFRSAFRLVTDSFVKSPATEVAGSDGE